MRSYRVIQALTRAQVEADVDRRYADYMVISSLVLWVATEEASGQTELPEHQVEAMNRLLEALDMGLDIIK